MCINCLYTCFIRVLFIIRATYMPPKGRLLKAKHKPYSVNTGLKNFSQQSLACQSVFSGCLGRQWQCVTISLHFREPCNHIAIIHLIQRVPTHVVYVVVTKVWIISTGGIESKNLRLVIYK